MFSCGGGNEGTLSHILVWPRAAIENRRPITITSAKLRGPFDSSCKAILPPKPNRYKVLVRCNCRERVNAVRGFLGLRPNCTLEVSSRRFLWKTQGNPVRVRSGTHQPRNTVTHLTVAIWSSAWFPLPDPIAMRLSEIPCVFGGFPALRLAVVSATCISSVLPATLTFKLGGINCVEIYAADRFALK
jgi:hypothetical protein